jgi:hypothetical protein
MADKILHKRSLTSGSIPTTSSLDIGELAINVHDGKLFLHQSGSSIDQIINIGESASFATSASFAQTSSLSLGTNIELTINGTTQDLSANRTYTVGNKFAIIGNPAVTTASSLTRFVSPFQTTNSTSETLRSLAVPFDVTINKFYIGTSAAQPATGSSIFTLRKNGVATSIVITIPAGSLRGVFSDTTHSESFAAGDLISIEHVNNATSNAAQIAQITISE